MKAIDYCKQLIAEAEKQREDFLQKDLEYVTWKNLPWWRRWTTFHVVKSPDFHIYREFPLHSNWHQLIELRLLYSKHSRSVTLAINENNCGYRLDILTGEKEGYLGRVDMTVSAQLAEYAENLRKELAPLFIE